MVNYIEPHVLANMIKEQTSPWTFRVIDVRDEDFRGGNIKNCINIPQHEFTNNIQHYIDHHSLDKYATLIFHCALSQVRGPKSATRYFQHISNEGKGTDQKVLILRGGFTQFAAMYSNDGQLVVDYDESLQDTY